MRQGEATGDHLKRDVSQKWGRRGERIFVSWLSGSRARLLRTERKIQLPPRGVFPSPAPPLAHSRQIHHTAVAKETFGCVVKVQGGRVVVGPLSERCQTIFLLARALKGGTMTCRSGVTHIFSLYFPLRPSPRSLTRCTPSDIATRDAARLF